MKKQNIALIALTLLALFALAGCSPALGTATQTTTLKAAPAFTVETINGETISSETNKAEQKPMILYFMASTCTSCAKNWKAVDEVYPEYKDKIDFVAVSVDPTDDVATLQKLASDRGFTFDSVAGNPALALTYEVKKQTAKFAIDKEGNIISRHDGVLSADEWKALFESLI